MPGKAGRSHAITAPGMADVASGAAGAPASTAGASKKTEPAKATSSSKVVVDPRFVIPSAWSKDKDKEKLPPPSSAEEEDDDDDDDAAGGGAEDSSDADDDGSEAGSEDHSGDEDAEEVDSDDGGGGDDEGSGDDDAEGAGAADGVAGDSAVGEKRKRPMGATELAPEKLAAFQKAEKRKGIVYIGRVPPFMKPIKLRQLLAPYGDIGRVYLAPEDPAARKRRIAAGGNKKPMFTEGWVEFMKKKDAKFVVATLNNEPMGGNKRDFYGSDLWVLKYLPHFKWHHLTEKIAYEGRIRAQKLRVELAAARKEAEHYIGQAELAKSYAKRDTERAARAARKGAGGDASAAAAGGSDDGAAAAGGAGRPSKKPRSEGAGDHAGGSAGAAAGERELDNVRRHFRQRAPVADSLLDRAAARAAAEGGGAGSKGKSKRA